MVGDADSMELNRREVPLYGQVEVCVEWQAPGQDSDPEGAEYYVVLEGSTLDHVTSAQWTSDGKSLVFNAPGHNLAESVSVGVYVCVGEDETAEVTPLSPSGSTLSLKYVQDKVQDLAELLMSQSGRLSSSSYRDILKKLSPGRKLELGQRRDEDGDDAETFSLGGTERQRGCGETQADEEGSGLGETPGSGEPSKREEGGEEGGGELPPHNLKELDGSLTLALANMAYPCEWNGFGTKHIEGQDHLSRETPLHLAVRLGLPQLCHFLLQQPGGQKVVTLLNEEGDTPLSLVESRGDETLLAALTTPSDPTSALPTPISQVWVDCSSVLRVCSTSGALSLTAKHTSSTHTDTCAHIHTYRRRVKDWTTVSDIRGVREDAKEERRETEESGGHSSSGELRRDLLIEGHALVDSVFEEQLVLSLDEDDDLILTSKPDKSCSPSASKQGHTHTHSTASAAARLSAMLNGKGQVDDPEVKVAVAGVTGGSTTTDGEAASAPPGATDTPPPGGEEKLSVSPSISPSPIPSPADLALARLFRSSRTELPNQAQSSPSGSCDLSLSPALVALEVDSEEEDDEVLIKSPLPQLSSEPSGDERDSADPAPEPTCTRTLSTSSALGHTSSKNAADQGVRMRSYSYSSPKISLRPPRFSRDTNTPPTSELTQEQRALSLSEQTQEKRELRFRRRAQSAEDESSVELADSLQHLTLSEFLKEIEEEEWDRYIIPSKTESDKYKVSRTFSFLKSRMSSTRNKNKCKAKDREGKDRQSNGHLFSSGSCAGATVCLVCDKPATGKDLLHCSNCTLTVHKGCRDSATPCLKKLQDKYAVSMVKSKTASLPQNFTVRDSSNVSTLLSTSASLPVMVSRDNRKDSQTNTLSRSVPTATEHLSESPEGDTDSPPWRHHSQSDEILQKAESSTSTDSSIVEDVVDSPLQSELVGDAMDLEAESWSLAVQPHFCKSQEKHIIKRQDVIYELMQTELHHVQTLSIMAEVFRRGLREEVQLDPDAIGRIFPCLDELLPLHRDFLSTMRERRHGSAHPDGDKNYIIHRIGDILLQQFSGENAERMKQVYGQFCSHHTEAVSFFKELQQQNKRFQTFIKQQSSNSLVRRKEIPECILLVTQRITKYPVLLERILHHTQEGTVEHAEVSRSLVLIRELIAAVDQWVRQYEQEQRLQEVLTRLENKSTAKLKNGHTFRKQDVQAHGRTLTHQGLVFWKTATGRLKDVLALLLTDTLILLQEKDQKYTFAAVDQKPPVISLQKLIVREVANEERGMFLISASSAGPEMYEVHTVSKEDRNTWMRLIREAVESCPEEDEENTSESEEEKRVSEARVQKIQQIQESLISQDQLICSTLEEKLQIYSELNTLRVGGAPEPEPRLLVRPNPEEVPQAAALLAAALREVEILKATLSTCCDSLSSPSQHQAPPSVELTPPVSPKVGAEREASPPESEPSPLDSSPRQEDPFGPDSLSPLQLASDDPLNMNVKVCEGVQSLTQLLYSLQAAVTIQDSCFEIQRLLLSCSPRPSPVGPCHPRQGSSSSSASSSGCLRGNALQEQERQREAERRREELAGVARLQTLLTQERQQWERERSARHLQQEAQESRLELREQQCHLEAERLQRERRELDEQLQDYQHSLERLREGQRSLERERTRVDTQTSLVQSWRHSRQRSLPGMVIPLDTIQDTDLPLPEGSVFVNEAAYHTSSLNNRHPHHHRHHPHHQQQLPHAVQPNLNLPARTGPRGQPDPLSHTHNSINFLLDRSAQPGDPTPARTTAGQPAEQPSHELNMSSIVRERWSPGTTFPSYSPPFLLDSYITMETEGGEDGVEENIVYL
ncbi:rho guanine nucleotide exchange factor 28 isoform X2 [Clupea harengus]|uniref:Rho guanine nucleotide exchange factor 28 isoform X2 n=1 Tax=Clupea harengus TaxID=7950 RepID=A0A6P8G985_CLUHA|nr:rho guanine nucleotide exchange factor 28 isoform X2 [Clupea harengus]